MASDSNASFYNQNAVTYTDTNPAGPVDTPITTTNTNAPSSFYKGTGDSIDVLIAEIQPFTPILHNWLNGVSETGGWSYSQPAFTDISGVIAPNQICDPTLTTIGGIMAIDAVAHQWVSYIDTAGQPHLAQPSFADISGTIAPTQMPVATATTFGVIEAIAQVAHQWVSYIDNSGVPHLTQPAFSDLSGNISVSQMASGTGASSSTFWRGDNTWGVPPGSSTANPSALVGLTAINGVAGTVLRSDAAPALDQSISPTWTGLHTFEKNAANTHAIVAITNAFNNGVGNEYGSFIQHTNVEDTITTGLFGTATGFGTPTYAINSGSGGHLAVFRNDGYTLLGGGWSVRTSVNEGIQLSGAHGPVLSVADVLFKSGSPWVDVKAYGALGNFNNNFSTGSDDTSAIQAAINATSALSGTLRSGGICFLPPGTYRISSPLSIPGDIQLRGAGRNATIIINSSTTNDILQVTGNSVTISDLTLYGCGVSTVTGAAVPTSGWAIDITSGGNNCKFKDLVIGRTFHGINVGSSASNGDIEFVQMFDIYGQYMINGAPGWTIQDNQLDMTFYGGVYGPTAEFQAWGNSVVVAHGDVQFTSTGYYYCTGGGTTAATGTGPSLAFFGQTISDGTATWEFLCSTNLVKINLVAGSATVRGNDLSGPSRFGIKVSSGSNTIDCNNFGQIIGIALQITGGQVGNSITNNKFTQTFASSSDVTGSGLGNHINAVAFNTVVSGNVFNESSGVSISWASSTDFTIGPNAFIPPYGTPNLESAIQLVSCSSFGVQGNSIPAGAAGTGSIVVSTPTGNNYNVIGNMCGGVAVSNTSGFGNVLYNT